MVAKQVIQNGRPLSLADPGTPLNSAGLSLSNSSTSGHAPRATPLPMEHLKKLLLKLIEVTSKDPAGAFDGTKPDATTGDAQPKTLAEELESQLSQIFKIAGHWKVILLSDEADVFLE